MTSPDIMEAAVQAMPSAWSEYDRQWVAWDILAAVTPLIRAAALEEAAKVAAKHRYRPVTGIQIAREIRTLKEQSSTGPTSTAAWPASPPADRD